MRKLYCLALLLLTNTIIFAQSDFKSFRFGLKAAPNIAWLKPDSEGFSAERPALKFSYGLVTEFALSENYFFATGIQVATMGGSLNFPDSAFYYVGTEPNASVYNLNRRRYNLQYVEIPLTLKMRTNEIGYMRYFGQFGIDLGVRTQAKAADRVVEFTAGQPSAGGEVLRDNIDVANDIQLFRAALHLGIGGEYTLTGNTALLIGVNYSNGFTNSLTRRSKTIVDGLGAEPNRLNQNATTNYVALTVGILF
jgi:hypothetical protein